MIILLFFLSFSLFASSLDFLLDSDKLTHEKLIFQNKITQKASLADVAISNTLRDSILNDKQNLVKDDFIIPEYFKSNVYFWFSVYTQYYTHQIIIHDKSNLDLVYKAVDYSHLKALTSNNFLRFKTQNDLVMDEVVEVKKILMKFAEGKEADSEFEKGIYRKITALNSIPKNKEKKREFFKDLALNIRTQTGQRDVIFQGISNSLPYLAFFDAYFKVFELPKEMLAVSFLESSFNPRARSRVNAVGAWQIMPVIAQKLMPYSKGNIDTRYNPVISSLAAFHLLKENFSILNRWDLAVTAYNSGTKHLLRAKRLLGSRYEHSLENIFIHYENDHHGFASKNFYSEFLALVHVLAYKEVIFSLQEMPEYKSRKKTNDIALYVTKCNLIPDDFIAKFSSKSKEIEDLNTHFLKQKKRYGPGQLVVSTAPLPEGMYYQLNDQQLRRKWPINWKNFATNSKCIK